MDSLSQIVLGAAVGEAYLGRRLGNRAMLWGAIAGTIPDLDVIGNLWMSEIDSLAFHRGVSHSLFFAVVFSLLIAYPVHKLYSSDYYRRHAHRSRSAWVATIAMSLLVIPLPAILVTGGSWLGGLASVALLGTCCYILLRRLWTHYVHATPLSISVSYREWYLFFFLTIFTHPLLDCCTAYGTQLWAPFSDERVSWNIISVADPLWTLPFGLSLVCAACYARSARHRRLIGALGWIWAIAYMSWTYTNKQHVNRVFEQSLADQGIVYSRYTTGPSILQNLLWTGTAEADGVFYQGMYSLLDEEPRFDLSPIPQQPELVDALADDEVLETLHWFTDGYFAYMLRDNGKLQLSDLRYGSTSATATPTPDDFVFRFILERDADGRYYLGEAEGGPPKGKEKEMMIGLWERVRGI